MTLLTELLDSRARVSLNELVQRWLRIDILVVTDTIVSFGPEHDPRNLDESVFGMSHLIGVLEQVGKVTRAHRGNDPLSAPNVVNNFRFDAPTTDLGVYDQIWLLGYATGTLPVTEQAAIAAFMNAGGGVFATGDHAGLGSALAGHLPRVRSMRHWASPPPALGAARIDTTRPDVNGVTVFENQSDDIPQQLRLKWYPWSSNRWTREVYPHPLLCSRSGAITEFPDHMHEGEVVEPTVLDAKISYAGGAAFDEYPAAGGNRVAPEIVAWGWTTGHADPEVMHGIHTGDPGNSTPRWTGTIGAYDGHLAGVGRVVVHSTWHHFFDINLIGDNAANRPGFTDPRAPLWRLGFQASADGLRVLGQIDEYYRNIAHWLSPGIGLIERYQALAVQLAMTHPVRELLDAGVAEPATLGAHAWEYALRYLPPCTLIQFVNVVVEELRPFDHLPWPGPNPKQSAWPLPPKQLAQAAVGGAVLAISRLESIDQLRGEEGATRLRKGARAAVQQVLQSELERSRAAEQLLERALRAVGGQPPGHEAGA
jgi:hypothetical protein